MTPATSKDNQLICEAYMNSQNRPAINRRTKNLIVTNEAQEEALWDALPESGDQASFEHVDFKKCLLLVRIKDQVEGSTYSTDIDFVQLPNGHIGYVNYNEGLVYIYPNLTTDQLLGIISKIWTA